MIEEIRPHFFRLEIPLPNSPVKFLNSYVIRSSDRNLIIDTGLNRKECLDAMQSGLRQLGIDLKKTDFFITHLHADHFALVSKIVTPTSRLFFNRPETELIEASGWWERMISYAVKNGFPENELRQAIRSHPGREFGSEWIPEISVLQDGDQISAGDYHFRCVSTPGHSLGRTCLHEPNKKILVAGDHILIDIVKHLPVPSFFSSRTNKWWLSMPILQEIPRTASGRPIRTDRSGTLPASATPQAASSG